MENKYYTPEIEEFHVGFEYEFRTLKGWDKEVMSWNDYPSYAGDYIGEAIKETDGIRVKYLDQEDIESFGFELRGDTYYGFTVLNKPDPTWLELRYGGWGSELILNTDQGYVLFRGVIENKSELKRVLKMIGYEGG
tara:strand:- start:199 stop:606 length:408 start_codon:yes stop_codon:yes gene_type:complete